MPKAMIITVGTGETVSHGICCAIRQQNPEYIVFLLTKESKGKTLPLILNDVVMKDREYEEMILNDENDIEEIKIECEKVIDKLIKKHIEPKDITIDYTSGTKAMSAGVVLAALEKRLGTLVYVSGKRDKNGRVISGTERVVGIEPNKTYAESLFREAVNLFNSCQFNGCLELISQTKHLVTEPEFQNKIELLEKLAQGYSLWDKFDLAEAFSIIDVLSKNQLLPHWEIKAKIKENKERLYKEKENLFCLERVVDLLENARRRGEIENKYDDAIARLYRCLEYIAQLKIAERDLYERNERGGSDTEALDIDKLPSELKNKYLKYKDPNDNKVKLGLEADYKLLYDLGDDLGKFFKKEYEKGLLKKLLSLRNKSILAHGFNPILEKVYKEIIQEVERLIKEAFPNIENITEKIKFPQIRI